MDFVNQNFQAKDGVNLVTYFWECEQPKGVVHIVHGMSEHAARYNDFALFLNEHGYLVYASDLRGHGKTAGSLDKVGNFAMQDGWNKVVGDVIDLSKELDLKYPNLPLYILGHSMGSFISRNIAILCPPEIDGYIFSATAGHPGLKGWFGKHVSNLNLKLMGKKNNTPFMDFLMFWDYNLKYENKRTKKDWLSKDEAIVDAYMADPFCMQVFTSQFFNDLLKGVFYINETYHIRKMEKEKPILLFAGDMDPVGDYGKGPQEVYNKFKKSGIKDVTLKMYASGRHEMLNETNRAEVYEMVLNWLNEKTK
ncbi:MAG: lysophospholipase [Flavobacteriales bacterium]|jgi:alpha-beta hydrolase superfamily lysophospholipase|nr:lysophospholipase [Flavobacteriales bacterium]